MQYLKSSFHHYRQFALKLFFIIMVASVFTSTYATPADAAYSINYQTASIQIDSSSLDEAQDAGHVVIEGTSTINQVWFCLRGPNGEITVYPVDVQNGRFKKDIWMRFGSGTYTIWAGDNGTYFDGKIRFQVNNTNTSDYKDLTPSGYVNSDDPNVIALSYTITNGISNEYDKAKAIHNWVIQNIAYDTVTYYNGTPGMNTALQTMESKKGLCRDYSFTFASLARAAGIQTKVVYGDAWSNASGAFEKHAWNQAYVNGAWISIDTTWDAGYIKNRAFVASPSDNYFNMDPTTFQQTHILSSVTLY